MSSSHKRRRAKWRWETFRWPILRKSSYDDNVTWTSWGSGVTIEPFPCASLTKPLIKSDPPPPLTVVFHFPPKMCLKKRKMRFQRNRMSSGENEEVSNKPFSAISLAMMTTSFNQLPFLLSLLAASSNHLQRCASNQLWLDFFNATMSKCERAFPCNSRLPTILLTTLSHTWVF